MQHWQGHHLITRAVLEELLLRAASDRLPATTRQERVLFTACEFWAAAAEHVLCDHLLPTAVSRLQTAAWAFTEISAFHAAEIVDCGVDALRTRSTSVTIGRVAAAIEGDLASIAATTDEFLAAFATEIAASRRYVRWSSESASLRSA